MQDLFAKSLAQFQSLNFRSFSIENCGADKRISAEFPARGEYKTSSGPLPLSINYNKKVSAVATVTDSELVLQLKGVSLQTSLVGFRLPTGELLELRVKQALDRPGWLVFAKVKTEKFGVRFVIPFSLLVDIEGLTVPEKLSTKVSLAKY